MILIIFFLQFTATKLQQLCLPPTTTAPTHPSTTAAADVGYFHPGHRPRSYTPRGYDGPTGCPWALSPAVQRHAALYGASVCDHPGGLHHPDAGGDDHVEVCFF